MTYLKGIRYNLALNVANGIMISTRPIFNLTDVVGNKRARCANTKCFVVLHTYIGNCYCT